MARGEGKRVRREQAGKTQQEKLGNYLIITDTEGTEKSYFDGLHKSLPKDKQSRIVVKVIDGIKTDDLVRRALDEQAKQAKYGETWIVFDRDRVPRFNAIIDEAEKKNIHAGWSNPCIEIWFLAYYGSMKSPHESKACVELFTKKFKDKTGLEYDKKMPGIYRKLCETGDESLALKIGKAKYEKYLKQREIDSKYTPFDSESTTSLYQLVEAIHNSAKKT